LEEYSDGEAVFRHACELGLGGFVSKRKDSAYRSGRSPDWLKMKNADAPAVKREAEEDWGKERWRRDWRRKAAETGS
jgi:ATP-dependent DNA ligase